MDLRNTHQQIIFKVTLQGDTLNVLFGEPATTEELTQAAVDQWTPEALAHLAGRDVKLYGALPVSLGALLGVRLKNLSKSLSFYVPREQNYVTSPLP